MPFKSEKQRALFLSAKESAMVRRARGFSLAFVERMLAEDSGESLPSVVEPKWKKKRNAKRKT